MVIKGTKRNRPKPQQLPDRPPPTRRITKIAVLKKHPLKEDALDLLHELAKLVTPIMDRYNFTVGLLCEMFPKKQNLLGLNVNGGLRILIRLRQHHNHLQFLSKSELIGTVLHELTHNKYGPHNNDFYSFLDKITRDFEDMMSRNSFNIYGEVNFDNMFGNNSMLNKQIGKTATIFDEKVHRLGNGKLFSEVNRLGSRTPKSVLLSQNRLSMREIILQATERRLKDGKRCHETVSQKDEQAFIKSMEDGGEIPLNDEDLDIIVIDDDDDHDERIKRKRTSKKPKEEFEQQQQQKVVVVIDSNDEEETIVL